MEGIKGMEKLKAVHRISGITVLIVLLYLAVTGLVIQAIDLRLIFTHAPLTDPDMMTMMETPGGGYQILTVPDLTAQALPADVDVNAMLQKVLQSAPLALGNAPLRFVEFRMVGGKPVGQVQTKQENVSFDGATGALIQRAPVPPPAAPGNRSLRYKFKEWHRLTIIGNYAPSINVLVGLLLFVMVVTGVPFYFKLLKERKQSGPSGFFWAGKGTQEEWKRAMHRGVGLVGAIFLLVVAFSGVWLAYESAYLGIHMAMAAQQRKAAAPANAPGPNGPAAGAPAANRVAVQTLKIEDLPAELRVTLDAERAALNGAPIKVIRIRTYQNHVQGVVVTGEGNDTSQLVYNAQTGLTPSEAELGISQTSFPFGWDAHQLGKAIHRGSYFGLWARIFDFLAGLALIYLCLNGFFLYVDFWLAARKAKKAAALAS